MQVHVEAVRRESLNGSIYYPFREEKDLIKSILRGDLSEALQSGDVFLKNLYKYNSKELLLIQVCVLHLTTFLIRNTLQIRITDIDVLLCTSLEYIFLLSKSNSVTEINEILNDFIQQLVLSICFIKDDRCEKYEIIQKAKKFIDLNFKRPISLDKVAKSVYLSPCYFSRIFSKLAGCTFQEYLTKVRINAAKRLLVENSICLEEVAYQVGYNDVSYFIRVFKKTVGTTPRQFTRFSMYKEYSEPEAACDCKI